MKSENDIEVKLKNLRILEEMHRKSDSYGTGNGYVHVLEGMISTLEWMLDDSRTECICWADYLSDKKIERFLEAKEC